MVLYKHLREKSLQTLRGAVMVSPRAEWEFVLHTANLYERMGCDLLALDLGMPIFTLISVQLSTLYSSISPLRYEYCDLPIAPKAGLIGRLTITYPPSTHMGVPQTSRAICCSLRSTALSSYPATLLPATPAITSRSPSAWRVRLRSQKVVAKA